MFSASNPTGAGVAMATSRDFPPLFYVQKRRQRQDALSTMIVGKRNRHLRSLHERDDERANSSRPCSTTRRATATEKRRNRRKEIDATHNPIMDIVFRIRWHLEKLDERLSVNEFFLFPCFKYIYNETKKKTIEDYRHTHTHTRTHTHINRQL